MLANNNLDIKNDFTPICYNTLFVSKDPDRYVEITTSKSFSKSNQKKLKLINDSKSLEKSAQFHQKIRKIRPLKVKINKNKNAESSDEGICSIREFKARINRITQESILKTIPKFSTRQTDISDSIQTTHKTSYASIHPIQTNMASSQKIKDPFPTLAGSLVVQEGIFNPQSLLQSKQNSHPSNQVSLFQSPTHKDLEPVKKFVNFHTPVKERQIKEESDLQTRDKTAKKQRLTLNMARKVQTHETLKTQNQACHSIVQENEYKKFFDNIAFPDYFSPKFRGKENPQKSGISQNSCPYFENEKSK